MREKKRLTRVLLTWGLIFWGVAFTIRLTALDPRKSISQYRLELWDVERGFPSNAIKAIVQTYDGYIWVGTNDGLVRFDGIRPIVFNTRTTKELKSNNIQALFEDREKNLWIGTYDGGLTCLKSGNFSTVAKETVPALNNIVFISDDRNGTLWIGTYGNGVTCLKNDKFSTYTQNNGLAGNDVMGIIEDQKGNLWFATSAGFTRQTPSGKFITHPQENQLIVGSIHSICRSQTGEIWAGTGKDLLRITDGVITPYGKNHGLPLINIISLYYVDETLTLWVGTDGNGLFRVTKEGKIESFSIKDGMVCDYVSSFLEDREGSLWVGTLEGGLHRFLDTRFTNLTNKDGLAHNHVHYLWESPTGHLWIGTDGGLNRFNENEREFSLAFTVEQGLLSNVVYSVMEDGDNNLWIGTEDGLHRFKDGKLHAFTTEDGLVSNNIYCLAQDSRGQLWIGTSRGLNYFYKGQFKIFYLEDGNLNTTILSFVEDREGNLWIGTEKGLYRKKQETVTHFTTKEGLVGNYVEFIYEDNEGILYMATLNGLSRRVGSKFVNYTTENGLISNRISCITEDDRGNLWIAGRMGISRISKKELRDFEQGKINKIMPTNYNELDGMKTRWVKHSGLKTRDGRLWFATDKGIIVMDAANIPSPQPPPVIIERLQYDETSLALNTGEHRYRSPGGELVVIPPGTRRLEFYYTALSFLNSYKIQFRLKLAGYDSHWQYMGNTRSVKYMGLPPGYYTFLVSARTREEDWNLSGDRIFFYVKPYFTQTAWFYVLVAVVGLLVVFLSYRFRIRHLIAREKKLNQLVNERTRALNSRTLELEKSRQLIEKKNWNIMSSIEYARRIQQGILPSTNRMKSMVSDCFVFFKPKAVVSGDFFWFHQGRGEDRFFIAVVDCTGHGVPGAILSMIGNMKLNQLVSEKRIYDPGQILFHLHIGVRRALKQESEECTTHDGMEVALCMVDIKQKKIIFAGAKRPLYYYKKSNLYEIKGDRKPIGGIQKEKKREFTNHEIQIDSEIIIYLPTDGFVDQNDRENNKYGTKRLKKFLQAHAHLSLSKQEDALLSELKKHQGREEQRDDITILGIKMGNK